MRRQALVTVIAGMLLLASFADAQETLRAGGVVVEPDPKIQDALKRLLGDDHPSAVHDLAKLSGTSDPDHKVQRRARQHLAEQLFLFAVRQKWAVEGYNLFLISSTVRTLQGTLHVGDSYFVNAAASNIGHEDRTIHQTAQYMLAIFDAFTPFKVKGARSPEYHFHELENYLEHVRKLDLAPEEAAGRVILAMYQEDAEAALNTMVRAVLSAAAAKGHEALRALPDLRRERECVARVRFVLSVGSGSDAAEGMRPAVRQCVKQLAGSAHWYVRLYVAYLFLQDDAPVDAQLLDRLADDSHPLVRQAVRDVRDTWRRREAEKAERAAEQAE
jgi:hypothetical protein